MCFMYLCLMYVLLLLLLFSRLFYGLDVYCRLFHVQDFYNTESTCNRLKHISPQYPTPPLSLSLSLYIYIYDMCMFYMFDVFLTV